MPWRLCVGSTISFHVYSILLSVFFVPTRCSFMRLFAVCLFGPIRFSSRFSRFYVFFMLRIARWAIFSISSRVFSFACGFTSLCGSIYVALIFIEVIALPVHVLPFWVSQAWPASIFFGVLVHDMSLENILHPSTFYQACFQGYFLVIFFPLLGFVGLHWVRSLVRVFSLSRLILLSCSTSVLIR